MAIRVWSSLGGMPILTTSGTMTPRVRDTTCGLMNGTIGPA